MSPSPVSRRERPAKPALSRAAVVAAARTLLNVEGLGAVTMRRVAAQLDTGPASLYVYVRDAEDLQAQLLDDLLAPATAAALPGASWRERLRAMLGAYAAVLLAHPSLARAALTTQPSGPHFMRLVDALLASLREGGAGEREAAWGVDLLLLMTTAQAAEKAAWREEPGAAERFASLARAVRDADPTALPHVAGLAPQLLSGGPERLDWGLDVLIGGILAASGATPPTRQEF